MQLAVQVHRDAASWQPRPVKRAYIPKAGNRAKLRPLGIPVIADRCHQGRVRNALEPEWEARFEPKSYGFRPGRSCRDAIQAIYTVCRGQRAKRVWALDADLAAALDRIDHSRLLDAIGSFPARDMVRDWLKAGVIEAGKGFAPADEGTPQGGVSSPQQGWQCSPSWSVLSAEGVLSPVRSRMGIRWRMVIFSGPMRTSLTSSFITRWRS
ncbi:reverse transcriptase domain-containing protein [Nocardia vaccinii]|uniref:reverse transcriptase domain-containing protein n=1 Tax=Nocardia vaccinii TaxID=1822 RepID=UPI001FE0225C|nr:reverse transcriptase domain-containing protein [Nocardia vaccinii]